MQSDIAEERQQAHALLDMLPGDKVAAVRSLLEVMIEPSYTVASAPVEEESLTAETADSIKQARASLRRGEGIPHDEILRGFGINA